MGKTPKPLSLLVAPELINEPEITALHEKGHVIDILDVEADLILHPKAWRMDKDLLKYLDVAIKSARGIKYPKGKK